MSLLFRDELRVVLTPEQVLMVRIKRAMTYRGLRRKVLEKKAVLCAAYAAGGTQWGAALQALEAALTVQAGRKAFATVVLSNHFMRYALLPWSDVPVSEDEEMSYARHTFRQAYGDAAESWELRLSPGRIGQPHLMTAAGPASAERAHGSRCWSRGVSVWPCCVTVAGRVCAPRGWTGTDAWPCR